MKFENDIKECVRVLKAGEIILYPTDTIWGLGCDATNEAAVTKIFELKKREEQKSMIILLSQTEDIKNYCKSPSAKIQQLLLTTEKPLSIIYPAAKNIAANLISNDGTIAIRVVKDMFCAALIKTFGKPVVSTSANISGNESPKKFKDISTEIINAVNYVVDYRRDENSLQSASKIIRWKSDDEIIIIRE